ncbi:MAG TPA: xylulokinase [Lactobacillus sp.]|nr:xylulokinase [Lactobacillus sp.]
MAKYILAHDLGTSGNKATLYDVSGRLVGSKTYHYGISYVGDNGVEQDPEDWWTAVQKTTKALTAKIDPKDILAVSFSGQMMGCTFVDKRGRALRPSMIWADMRSTGEVKKIATRISDYDFYHVTGHRNSASYGAQKLMWIKEHEPSVYRNTYKVLNAKDFITLRLTGKFVTDYSDASSTNVFDLNKFEWSSRLADAMDLDLDKFPTLHASTDVVGYVTKEAANKTGLVADTPVVCGGGDGVCAAVGTDSVREGTAHCSLGTSSWVSVTTRKPVFDKDMKTFNWAHIVPGHILPTGTMQSGGGAYAWFVENVIKQVTPGVADDVLYKMLEDKIQQSPIGAKGLIFLPYLMGERSPRWNPDARASFIGLTMKHEFGDMLRSIQEGVAMNLNIILQTFQNLNVDVQQMVAIGGGVRSAQWCQTLANVFETPIMTPKNLDLATSKGAVITGAVGVGALPDFNSASGFFQMDRTYTPDTRSATKYQKLTTVFNQAYDQLIPVFDSLHNLDLEAH